MTSRLNTDALENYFAVLRMHGGTYNHNPSVTAVRLAMKKYIQLHLRSGSSCNGNCMPDDDTPLVLGSDIPQCEPVASSYEDPFFGEECTDDASINTHVEGNDNINELSTPVSSLEACAEEYFAGYVAKKSIEKTACPTCYDVFVSKNSTFYRNEQILIFSGHMLLTIAQILDISMFQV